MSNVKQVQKPKGKRCRTDKTKCKIPCPKCKLTSGLAGLIFHMNDVHRMTNKQIGKRLKKYGL